jgi:hypothetical protein
MISFKDYLENYTDVQLAPAFFPYGNQQASHCEKNPDPIESHKKRKPRKHFGKVFLSPSQNKEQIY